MAVVRISPGIYEVDGKRVNAASKDEAVKKARSDGSAPGKKPTNSQAPVGALGAVKDKAVRGKLEDEVAVQDYQAGRQASLANPNTSTPFGSSSYDPAANAYSQRLDPAQQLIADQDAALSASARAIAQGMFGNIMGGGKDVLSPRMSQGDLNADRSRIEDELYGRYTKPIEQEYQRDKAAFEQRLASSGNPPGSPRYTQQMAEFEKRYDDRRSSARGQAVEAGGGELSRSFGMGETLRADQLGELGTFAGFGAGLRAPNLPGFQAPSPYQLNNPTDISLKMKELEAAIKQMQRQSGGGGGGGGGSQPPPSTSPFFG